MKRFKNILVPAGSPTLMGSVLRNVIWLAGESKARVTLMGVTEEVPLPARTFMRPEALQELTGALEEHKRAQCETLADRIRKHDIPVKVVVRSGTRFLETVRQVISGHHDLVVAPVEGDEDLKTRVLGSTEMHLLRKCPCPVWLVQPTRKRKFYRVLAAVGEEESTATARSLNQLILNLAGSFARLRESRLHVVHAWDLFGAGTLASGRLHLAREDMAAYSARAESEREEWLTGTLSNCDLSGIETKVHLIRGEARRVIPNLVHDKRIDLVVMGTLSRSGIAGLFIGNTAEAVLRQVECSVMAVKPEGFISPVSADH